MVDLSTVKFEVPPPGQVWAHTWAVAGDLTISFTQEGEIPSAIWTRFVADAASKQVKGHFGMAIGSISINSVQRKASTEAFSGKSVTAVTDSAIARGVITAVGWLGLNIKGYAWKDIDRAIEATHSEFLSTIDLRDVIVKLLKLAGGPSLVDMKK